MKSCKAQCLPGHLPPLTPLEVFFLSLLRRLQTREPLPPTAHGSLLLHTRGMEFWLPLSTSVLGLCLTGHILGFLGFPCQILCLLSHTTAPSIFLSGSANLAKGLGTSGRFSNPAANRFERMGCYIQASSSSSFQPRMPSQSGLKGMSPPEGMDQVEEEVQREWQPHPSLTPWRAPESPTRWLLEKARLSTNEGSAQLWQGRVRAQTCTGCRR